MGGGMLDDEPMAMQGGEDFMSGNVQPKEEPAAIDLRTGLPAASGHDLRRGGSAQADGGGGGFMVRRACAVVRADVHARP